MSQSSGFFISQSGDRKYTPDWLASYIKALVTSGVYKDELAVTAGDGMTISLSYGRAWVEGYLYMNDAQITMAIGNADSTLGRRDSVVIRLNLTARTITAMVLPGTFSASPTAPEPTRNADIYDLKLAEINVPAGTAKITQDLISDTRLDDAVCGITVCTVQHIPTATFLAQMQAGFASFMQENTEGFTSFMQESTARFTSFMQDSGTEFDTFMSGNANKFTEFQRESKETFDVWFAALLELFDGEAAGKLLNTLNGHIADKNNPHNVTALMIGAATPSDVSAVSAVATAAQQTLAQTSVPSRTVEVSAENLRAYIVGLPRLLTENLTIEVFSGKTANNGVVFQNFYGPGSLTVTAKETGTVICNYALHIENCNIPITINGFDIRSSGGAGTITAANTSISVELNKCSIDGAGYSGQTGIAANNAVISIANSVVKNFAVGVSANFGGVITLSDCTGAGNSIGISAQRGGIVSLYNSTDDMMGGISYRRQGGIIVKYDGTIIQ